MSTTAYAVTPRTSQSPQTPARPWTLAVWGEEEDESVLECRQVREVTPDVKTFTFASASGQLFHFDPGQFITLRLHVEGREVLRSYTVSSPPTRPHLLSITVKRKVGGLVSNWLHDHVGPGTGLRVQAPLGVFSLARHPAPKYLFLSAGSGITPLMSMTRTLADLGSDADVVFVHSARTPRDIIFRGELWALEDANPHLRVVHVCAEDSPDETWAGHRGLLDRATLAQIVPDLADREVFTCGPEPYMATVRAIVEDLGLDAAHYHQETFSFESLGLGRPGTQESEGLEGSEEIVSTGGIGIGAVPDEGAQPVSTGYAVQFTRTGRTIEVAPGETILQAAFASGITPPSSCSEGLCGTCKTSLLAGDVDMAHQGGIRPREVAAGKILICCSKPLSDLTLDA